MSHIFTSTANFFNNGIAKGLRKSLPYMIGSLSLTLLLTSCSQPDSVAPQAETAAAREATTLLNNDGFETSKIASFWSTEIHGGEGKMTKEQVRVGKQAMRFSFQKSKYDGTNSTAHTEIATTPLAEGETERWYGYSLYMPSASMANDPEPAILSQWHGAPDAGMAHTVPPLCFTLRNNQLELAYTASYKPIVKTMQNPTSSKLIDMGTVQYDQWVDYVVHIKWDPTGKQGVLQVWQNGVLKVNEQNIAIGYPETHKPYWKIGIYCWSGKAKSDERVVYFDEARIGGADSSYEAVRPGRSNGTAK